MFENFSCNENMRVKLASNVRLDYVQVGWASCPIHTRELVAMNCRFDYVGLDGATCAGNRSEKICYEM